MTLGWYKVSGASNASKFHNKVIIVLICLGENEVSTLKGYTGIPASTFRPPDPEESWDDSSEFGQQCGQCGTTSPN